MIISDCKEIRTHKQLLCKLTLNHLAKLTKWLSCTVSTYLCNAFKCVFLSSHIRILAWIYTLYLPECQGTFPGDRRDIWNLSDCIRVWTYSHLVRKGTINQLVKLANWLSCVVNTSLHAAFQCVYLSFHIRKQLLAENKCCVIETNKNF